MLIVQHIDGDATRREAAGDREAGMVTPDDDCSDAAFFDHSTAPWSEIGTVSSAGFTAVSGVARFGLPTPGRQIAFP